MTRLVLMHFIYSHKLSNCYLIFYKKRDTQIENSGNVGA